MCRRHKIVLRKPNRTIPLKPRIVAQDCLACVEEFEEFRQSRPPIAPGLHGNFDEKPFRPFQLWLNSRTLHYKGSKSVPMNKKHSCKVCLSCGICWYGDGTFKLVVVYAGSPRDEPYEEIEGILWLRCDSKWTRKETYRTKS